jgi:hypothetical protein
VQIRYLNVVQAQAPQDGGVQVVHVHRAFHGAGADVVGASDDEALLLILAIDRRETYPFLNSAIESSVTRKAFGVGVAKKKFM